MKSLRPRPSPTRLLVALGASLLHISIFALTGCEDPATIEEVRALHAANRHEQSLEPLRALLAEAPDDPELNYLYGAALHRTGAPDRAIWALRKAAASEAFALEAGLELGHAALGAQDWATAISIADDLIERFPDEPRALIVRAEARLSDKRDFDAALADFERAVEVDPDDLGLAASRAATLIALRRFDDAAEAIDALEKRAEADDAPVLIRGRICLTQALFASERELHEEAESRFERCREDFPRHRAVLDEYVSYLDKRSKSLRANALLEEQLAEEPRNAGARATLVRRLMSMKRIDDAKAVLEAGIEAGPSEALYEFWGLMADLELAGGDLGAAADAFEKSLEYVDEPTLFQRLSLADRLAIAERNDRALEVARGLENDVYRAFIEARVYLNRHEPARALARLDEALPLWPNNAGARYWAARAAEQTGNFERAIEEYRQSIRSGPAFSDASVRLGLIYEAEGKHEHAWAALNRLLEEKPDQLEAVALMTRLASRYGPEARLRGVAENYRTRVSWPTAVAARADDLASVLGPEEAIASIRSTRGLDLDRDASSPALRSLVRHLLAAGQEAEARAVVQSALTRSPSSSAIHEIHGLLLRLRGQAEAADAAYTQALELDPSNARALAGLGRVRAETGDLDAGLTLFARARTADPRLLEAYSAPARLLRAAGRLDEAEAQLEALLREFPHAAKAATDLARWRLARGVHDDRTLELARRAVRFRAGDPARQLLADVHSARGETEQARIALEPSEPAPSTTEGSAEPGEMTGE